jgi:hypothetical protein
LYDRSSFFVACRADEVGSTSLTARRKLCKNLLPQFQSPMERGPERAPWLKTEN